MKSQGPFLLTTDKGAMALETRLGEHARVSIDLDADHVHGVEAARADLQRAAGEDLGDHFAFAVAGSEELREAGVALAVRYKLESSVAARPFEPVQVDVSRQIGWQRAGGRENDQ